MFAHHLMLLKRFLCLGVLNVLVSCTGEVDTSNSSPITTSSIPTQSSQPSSHSFTSISSSNASNSSSPSADTCPTGLSNTDCNSFKRGQEEYTAQCETCHGDQGQGARFGPVNDHNCDSNKVSGSCADIAGLASYIGPNMPLVDGTPEDCADSPTSTCATDVATYISIAFAPEVSAEDLDNDGIVDKDDQCPNTPQSDISGIDHTGCKPANSGTSEQLVIAVNAGGEAYISQSGITFEADQGFVGGNAGGSTATRDIRNTQDDKLYSNERYAESGMPFSYEFDTENGSHFAVFHFSEAAKAAVNERVFDIKAEQITLLSDIDPFKESSGKDSAYVKRTESFDVRDDKATFEFISKIFNAQVVGIELYRNGDTDGDGDGVIDADEGIGCAGTKPNAPVNTVGCSVAQRDRDGDGIPIPEDLCPNTQANDITGAANSVDYPGCSPRVIAIDTDQDNIPDIADNCPNTTPGALVGTTGCTGNLALPNKETISPQMRLTSREYLNSIKNAFDDDNLPNITLVGDTTGPYGVYTNNADDNTGDFSEMVSAAQEIGDHLAQDYANQCNWSNAPEQCVRDHLKSPLETLMRIESVTAMEMSTIATVIQRNFEAGANNQQAIGSAIAFALIDDRSVYSIETGDDASQSGKVKLSATEFVSRLAYLLNDIPPDSELMAERVNLINNATNTASQADRLMTKEAYRHVAWQFVAEWLGIPVTAPDAVSIVSAPNNGDQCNTTTECRNAYPNLAQSYDCQNSSSPMSICTCDGARCDSLTPSSNNVLSLEASAYEETRRFVEYIIDNDLPFKELLTARYSFINKTLADHYNVTPPTNDWERYTFSADDKRQGILTQASFLTANGKHGRDKNTIFRGKVVFERFFCDKMPPPPPGAVDMADGVDDRGTHPACKGCHAVVDPIGRIFDSYDDTGQLFSDRVYRGGLYMDVDIANDYEEVVDLISALDDSKAFTHCSARQLFRFSLGRDATSSDGQSFFAVRDELDNNGSLKDAMRALITSDTFKYVYSEAAPQACLVGN